MRGGGVFFVFVGVKSKRVETPRNPASFCRKSSVWCLGKVGAVEGCPSMQPRAYLNQIKSEHFGENDYFAEQTIKPDAMKTTVKNLQKRKMLQLNVIFSATFILTFLFSTSTIGQDKVVLKNATDCAVGVGVNYYDMNSGSIVGPINFFVQPQTGGSTSVPQDLVVCSIFIDFDVTGIVDIVLFSNDLNSIPSAFSQCFGEGIYNPHPCYGGKDFSRENGSYFVSLY